MNIKIDNLPLDVIKVTSEFGNRNLLGMIWHNGVDFAAGIGTPVYAVKDGIVRVAKDNPTGYGLYVVIEHKDFCSLYAHMDSFCTAAGDYVEAGQFIGYSGNTGQTTGPHLHFEMRLCDYDNFWSRTGDIFLRCINPLPFVMECKNRKKIKTAAEAIDLLFEIGVINTPEHWKKVIDTTKYFDELLVKISEFIG